MLYGNKFIEILKKFPDDKKVLEYNGKLFTSGHLLKSSIQLAQILQEKGVNKNDKVLIAVKPGIDFLRIIYANMMLRTIVAIIDPEMGRENYLAKLNQLNPAHAFVDSRLIFLNEHAVLKYLIFKFNKAIPNIILPKTCQIFTVGIKLPIFTKTTKLSFQTNYLQSIPNLEKGEESDPFLITYTSGTLAEPKGVVHSYSGLYNSISLLTKLMIKNKDEAIATHLPHFVLLGINAGLKVFLWNNNLKAKDKIEFISKNKITTLFGPPSDFITLIEYCIAHKITFPNVLRNIYLGSAPVYNSFLTKLVQLSPHINIICIYGMTENLMTTYTSAGDKINYVTEGDLVGKPFENVSLKIDEDGDILVDSDQAFIGYWNQAVRSGFHRTGDLGKIDKQGNLILLGRKKDMIVRGNFNIYPGLYEPTINKIKGIKEAVMVGIYNDTKADEEVYLIVETEQEMANRDIHNKLKTGKYSIDKEALPDKILFMKIPKSGRQNKTNRNELKNSIIESGL